EMEPPIGQSVTFTSPDHWTMGTLWFCEKITDSVPLDAVVSWKDNDSTFVLRPQRETDLHTPGDSETTRFYDCGTSAALWNIGENVICKVKSWDEGMELEGDAIRAVRDQIPSVPVPEVIYTWLDKTWNRSFLLLKRVSGQRLEDVWPKLSTDQVLKVAADLAEYTVTLAQFDSQKLETLTGCGVNSEYYLFGTPDMDTTPSWKPAIRPIFTPETARKYLRDLGGEDPPDIGEYFYFYHPDMGPTNVFVSVSGPEPQDVHITAIIDWEAAAYYPHWWISLKPRVSAGFALGSAQEPEQWEWNEILSNALMDEGFDCPLDWYQRSRQYQREQCAKLESEST
ncbi:MAG: hypothetical protein M1830_001055, partial [Pleopsidium flavum]